jgi:hypothetical protein
LETELYRGFEWGREGSQKVRRGGIIGDDSMSEYYIVMTEK